MIPGTIKNMKMCISWMIFPGARLKQGKILGGHQLPFNSDIENPVFPFEEHTNTSELNSGGSDFGGTSNFNINPNGDFYSSAHLNVTVGEIKASSTRSDSDFATW